MERTWMSRRLLAAVVACVCALLLACAFAPQPAHAASAKNIRLTEGKTYTNYDVTGDGKADTIRIAMAGYSSGDYSYDNIAVEVNGSRFTFACPGVVYCGVMAKYMVMSNGREFLYIHSIGENDRGKHYVLKWKGGRLAKVLDTEDTSKLLSTYEWVKSIKAKGKRIVVTFWPQPGGVGHMNCTYSYAYKGGKLKRTSVITGKVSIAKNVLVNGNYDTKMTRSVVANRTLQGYSNAKCTKKSVKLRYGDRLKVKKLYLTKKCHNLQVKTSSGETCWIKIATKHKYPNTPMFQNAVFAG